MRKLFVTAALLGAVAAVALAQRAAAPKAPTTESLYISQSQLEGIMQSAPVSKRTGKPGSFSSRLFEATTFSTAFIKLEEPDRPHAHGAWSEVFVIREGSATLETGGTITGELSNDSAVHRSLFMNEPQAEMAQPAPVTRGANADIAGTAIEGGRTQKVKSGDVILIPAGVAHTFTQIDEPIVYLDIKFPKAE